MYYRGYVRPQDYQNEILRLKSRCRKLEEMLLECIEWLESRPDYTEGDLATASKARSIVKGEE